MVMQFAIHQQYNDASEAGLSAKDLCNTQVLKVMLTGLMLMIANIFTGNFAFITYMSSIFEAVHTQMEPNTNTIIAGGIQIVGTIASLYLVDRCGRKILLVVSCVGSGLATAAFGLYAFIVENTYGALSAYSNWLPATIMAFTSLKTFLLMMHAFGLDFLEETKGRSLYDYL